MQSLKTVRLRYISILKVVLLFMVCLDAPIQAQELNLIGEVELGSLTAASLDRSGAALIADKSGNVYRVRPDASQDPVYSPERNNKVSLIEAWTTLDILVFYEGPQRITVLNRFLTPIASYELANTAGFVRLATYSGESNIWILDDSDFSLKLFDVSLRSVVVNNPLNLVLDPKRYELTFMREYQNLLFISDLDAGILVFDNLGNYLRTITEASVSFFGFIDKEIYFVQDDNLTFIDIYTGKERSITVPPGNYHLMSKDRLYVATPDRLSIYSY